MKFPTTYSEILQRIQNLDPIRYGETRNHLSGDVSYLSPYISRGVISTKMVLDAMLAKGFQLEEIESLAKELCWRDYFQRVAQVKDVQEDLKFQQYDVLHDEIPSNVVIAETGIQGIDQAIRDLYAHGYMHNHARMYTASLVCNVAKSRWKLPSKWMYYHLLDGDFASNACSWQWVAGSNSNKKYYANQENINRYMSTQQHGTFMDRSYESFESMSVPKELFTTQGTSFPINLPLHGPLKVDKNLPTFLYTYYNMDPTWHQGIDGNRILLLEPSFFEQYPVSDKCIDFLLKLGENIPGIQVYVGSFDDLITEYELSNCVFKEHPLTKHFQGKSESRDWICPEVTGYYPSFFAYWKQVKKQLTTNLPTV